MSQVTLLLTSSEIQVWERPEDCPNTLDLVECWGAGGSGWGGNIFTNAAGGGGGGAYAAKSNYSIGLASQINVQIPGITIDNDIQPVDTWFDNPSTGVKAESGTSSTSIDGGVGGLASNSVGTIKYSGGFGGDGYVFISNYGGGGGGSATKNSSGNNGTNANLSGSGSGGNAGTGGGAGASKGNSSVDNVEGAGGAGGDSSKKCDGGSPGGGGGGRGDSVPGGSGGRGQIRITYTPITNIVLSMVESY